METAQTVCQSGLCPCLCEWASGLASGKRESCLWQLSAAPGCRKPTQVATYKIQTTLNHWKKALKSLRKCPRGWTQPVETPGGLGLRWTPLGSVGRVSADNSLGCKSVQELVRAQFRLSAAWSIFMLVDCVDSLGSRLVGELALLVSMKLVSILG